MHDVRCLLCVFSSLFLLGGSRRCGRPGASALTEPLTPFLRCMSGTNQRQSRCAALSGDIGDAVHCTIYENRPSPCREFAMSGENGEENDACNRARARYGLPPLRPLYKDIPALTGAESATTERFAVQSPAS